MERTRNWCFTINNYTAEDESSLLTLGHRYLVYGREVGECGTPHLQGFVVFGTVKSLRTLKSLMPRAHLEPSKADSLCNFKYCTKDGDFVEDGARPCTPKEKGEKGGEAEIARWDATRTACKEGRLDDIPSDIFIRNMGAIERYAKRFKPSPVSNNPESRNLWIYGPPGTGKSIGARRAGELLGLRTYMKNTNNKWWDNYDGEELVIMDDFDKYQVKDGGDMKRWLDIYPFQAETKGGQTLIRPKVVIVTSNYHPADIWTDELTVGAIARRCNLIHLKDGPFRLEIEQAAALIANKINPQDSART